MSASLQPLKPANFRHEQARHLLWRAGFGGSQAQVMTLVEWGLEKSVEHIVGYDNVEFESPAADLFDKDIMHPPSEEERKMYQSARRAGNEELLAQARLERERRERLDRSQMAEVQKWWLRRMIETPRPLEEKLTIFWHGHFATSFRTIENSYHMYLQNQLLRRHASGNFGELLLAIIRDPAMIAYLDNNDSRKGRPNENLARELMELFSLGVGNYSEDDIKEGARALTGYTFVDDAFVFQKQNHDNGVKNILGKSGGFDGDGFVRIILEKRACAAFIARKLYSFFVADVPLTAKDADLEPAQRAVLRRLAATLTSGRYELKPFLKKLFLSEHFYEPRFINQQVKSPIQLVVGAIRSLNTPERDLSILNDALDRMGQRIFFPPSVKGWDGGRSWINTSTYFVRQNIMAFLIAAKMPRGYDALANEQPFDPLDLLEPQDKHRTTVVDAVLRITLGHAPVHAKETLESFLAASDGDVNKANVTALFLLATAMPEYQLC